MRTNINISEDARELAAVFAQANGITLGDAISQLILRGGGSAGKPAGKTKFGRSAAGFPTLPKRGRVITTEMVKEALEDFI